MTPVLFLALSLVAAESPDDRADDRAAIRAHIESIYRAYIDKDREKVRATHTDDWQGFQAWSTSIIRGLKEYMENVYFEGPYGMTSFKFRDFDVVFQGDAAYASFIGDVEMLTPAGKVKVMHRIGDFYVKRDGKWDQAGSNVTLHPDSVAEQQQRFVRLSDDTRSKLLEAREAVWRAWFANDRATLEKLLPEETMAIDPTGSNFTRRDAIMEGSAAFAKSGGRLTKLEFPQTDIQCYGPTCLIYSTYSYELEVQGQKSQHSGRATELFVRRGAEWVNPGWHMDETH